MISRFFHALWNLLKMPWFLALLVTLILILLVWFLGPYVAFADTVVLESINARLIATVILTFCWGLFIAFSNYRQRKKEQAQPDKAEQHQQHLLNRQRLREEFDHIKKSLKTALKIVTTSNFYGTQRRSRYALPWYLLLGTNDCGKTSTLLNSGLKFPLNEQADRHLYQLKATEQCEVLYGNEAVFIDTPGAYTKSPPDAPAHKAWTTLLMQLLKVRPANPLNGIIACVSMRDIIDSDQAKRAHLAISLRTRLSEVLKRLHNRVPVYLIFTKCDAVPGFAHFFTNLSRAEREQVFGCPAKAETMEPGNVRMELHDLMQTLNAQIISKIHQERDIPSRGALFRFPQEIELVGPRIEDFISEAFGPSRYHRPVVFRGFYFTSALSAHNVLVAAAHEGEQSYQTGFRAAASDFAKGFFLLHLFDQCILPEAKLAAGDYKHWGVRLRRYGMQLSATAAFLFVVVFLGISFMNNSSRLENIANGYTAFTTERKKTPSTVDAKAVLPELEKIAGTTTVYTPDNDSNISYGLGLYQGKRFDISTNAAYLGTLNTRLMPALRGAAAEKIEKSLENLSELKSALRAYLMLCQPENISLKFLHDWLGKQWSDQYLGQADVQQGLRHHMDYLLVNGIMPVEPDATLLDKARKALFKTPLAGLVYQRMQEESLESGKPPFTFRAAIGESPFAGDTYAIPSLYTQHGFEEYLTKRCPGIIRSLTEEKWIFGKNSLALSALDMDKIHKEVRTMYFRDYVLHWRQAMQALQVRTPGTIADARNLAEQLTAGTPPTVLVLRELRANTDFIPEETEPDAVSTALADETKRKAQQKLTGKVGGKIAKALVNKTADSAEELQQKAQQEAQRDAAAVRQYFVPFVSLLTVEGNSNPTLKSVNDNMVSTGEYFAKILNSDNKDKSVMEALLEMTNEKDDTLRRMESSTEPLPSPVRQWYSIVVSGGLRDMLAIGAKSVNHAYQEQVISVYNNNLRANYPFNVHADKDVNLEDFATFFRGGGVLDNFHDSYLRSFTTRSGSLRSIMGQTLPVSSQAIVQLQRANRIQDAFFMSGRELGINFLMEPYALDATLKQVSLNYAGKTLKYWHGPVQGAGFTWPTANGQTDLAVLETGDLNGINAGMTTRGDWALFRLLQRGRIKRQEGNTCLVEVHQNDKWAQFLIQFRNKINPFDPKVCSFALPKTLL